MPARLRDVERREDVSVVLFPVAVLMIEDLRSEERRAGGNHVDDP